MNAYPTLFGCQTGGDGDVVIIGVPYDRGTDSSKSGCARAPQALRALSSPEELKIRNGHLYDLGRRQNIVEGRRVSDVGDVRFRPHQTDADYLAFVSEMSCAIASENKRVLALGGDHSITLAVTRGLRDAERTFQVVQLDAHHDYAPLVETERPTHATFVANLISEGIARQVTQIGVRGLSWGTAPMPETIKPISLEALASTLLPGVDVYLTVDTDAFDPAVAPGVSYPVPEGLTLSALTTAIGVIRQLGLNVIGADWTEFNPVYDTRNEITGRVVLRGLASLLECLTAKSGPTKGS